MRGEKWSTFARAQHPIPVRPALGQWSSYEHIQVCTGPTGPSAITIAVAEARVLRKIGLQVSDLLQALHEVARSDLLFNTM